MGAIFMLSCRTFGTFSTTKTVHSQIRTCLNGGSKKTKRYNYAGDDTYLRVHVMLADWSKRDLSDIEPKIVAKYALKERQEREIVPSSKARSMLIQQKQIVEQNTLKKQAFDDCMHGNSKRHKGDGAHVCVSTVLAPSCVTQPTTTQGGLSGVSLQRQKQWHVDFNKKQLEKKSALCHNTHLLQSLQTRHMVRIDDLSGPLGLPYPGFEA